MAQTMAVNTLVLGQVLYLFNSRFLRESSLRLESSVVDANVLDFPTQSNWLRTASYRPRLHLARYEICYK